VRFRRVQIEHGRCSIRVSPRELRMTAFDARLNPEGTQTRRKPMTEMRSAHDEGELTYEK
jgi:hypothetical protein